jgi:hypothetical protein
MAAPGTPDSGLPPRHGLAPVTRYALIAIAAGLVATVGACSILIEDSRGRTPIGAVSLVLMPSGTLVTLVGLVALMVVWVRRAADAGRPPVTSGPSSPSAVQGAVLAGSGILLAASGCGFFGAGMSANQDVAGTIGAIGFALGLLMIPVGVALAIWRVIRAAAR